MLEAVNSVLSNASYTKVVTDQQSVVNSYAANPERVQQVSQQAPYMSLYIKVDVNFDKALLQIRDRDTGDVVQQIPTESQLEAYRRAQASNAVRAPTAEEEKAIVYKAEESAPVVREASPAPAPSTSPAPAPEKQSYTPPAASVSPPPQQQGASVDTSA